MTERSTPRWWTMRRAQNLKPATYRCPLCGGHLPALSEHILLFPEGRSEGRRHAHAECVRKATQAGRLPTREDWQRTQPPPERFSARIRRRLAERRSGRKR
jgi:hypothetical protein